MDQIQFENWRKQHPLVDDMIHFPEGSDCRWGRIHAKWHEKADGRDLTHLCAFTLDLHTGDIYLDCTKKKIWMKFLALTIGRPYLGLAKTAYHLALPLSIPVEIFKAVYRGIQNHDSAASIAYQACLNTARSLADIIRTPLYTVVLTIASIAAVIIGPFAPSKLYDLRRLCGQMENTLTRGEGMWTLAPCFQPIENLADDRFIQIRKPDTVYDKDPILHRMNNLARRYIKHKRNVRNPFDDCCSLLNQKDAYISPACA